MQGCDHTKVDSSFSAPRNLGGTRIVRQLVVSLAYSNEDPIRHPRHLHRIRSAMGRRMGRRPIRARADTVVLTSVADNTIIEDPAGT